MREITPDYIAGFVDGEGCFALTVRQDIKHKRPNAPVYYSWKAAFAIVLRPDDIGLLQSIKDYFKVGAISLNSPNTQVRYQISDLDDLNNVIVPFFRKHQLIGKKGRDFELWSIAIDILLKHKRAQKLFVTTQWQDIDIKEIERVHQEMQPLKSFRATKKINTSAIHSRNEIPKDLMG